MPINLDCAILLLLNEHQTVKDSEAVQTIARRCAEQRATQKSRSAVAKAFLPKVQEVQACGLCTADGEKLVATCGVSKHISLYWQNL